MSMSERRAASLRGGESRRKRAKTLGKTTRGRQLQSQEAWMTTHAEEHRIEPKQQQEGQR